MNKVLQYDHFTEWVKHFNLDKNEQILLDRILKAVKYNYIENRSVFNTWGDIDPTTPVETYLLLRKIPLEHWCWIIPFLIRNVEILTTPPKNRTPTKIERYPKIKLQEEIFA